MYPLRFSMYDVLAVQLNCLNVLYLGEVVQSRPRCNIPFRNRLKTDIYHIEPVKRLHRLKLSNLLTMDEALGHLLRLRLEETLLMLLRQEETLRLEETLLLLWLEERLLFLSELFLRAHRSLAPQKEARRDAEAASSPPFFL